ncbi:MAG: arginyltransferase [Gammaproteobacteria bacterium]|jgi:arginine-tRNA-protein transferase
MSHPDSARAISFYITPEHACSYLPERHARTLFADPRVTPDTHLYSALAGYGFRRSGSYLYRPGCEECHACVPVRIPAGDFVPDRSQRRTLKRNADLTILQSPARFSQEHYALYQRYQRARHPGGGMDESTPDQYMDFLSADWVRVAFVEMRLGERLVAVAVTDRLDDGLSAVYTFFDPDESRRSPGTFAILWQLEQARREGLEWVYLGFYIGASAKMDYKKKFRPIEVFDRGRWRRIERGSRMPETSVFAPPS